MGPAGTAAQRPLGNLRSGPIDTLGIFDTHPPVEGRFRKARVRSHARLAAAWLYACERSGSKNQCPVPL